MDENHILLLLLLICVVSAIFFIIKTLDSNMKSGFLEESSFELTRNGMKLYMKGKQEKNDSPGQE